MKQDTALTLSITPGSEVTLHFALARTDGSEVISTFDDDPTTLQIGDGSLTEGLENTLLGLKSGDKQSVILEQEHAFGPRDDEKVQTMKSSDFPADMEIEPGLIVAFETPQGGEVAGILTTIEGDSVSVDFNHPLAGRDVVFTVEILAVKPPEAATADHSVDITNS